jgi:indolepyruvate ferredoxin oxidoreductase alpha subunit
VEPVLLTGNQAVAWAARDSGVRVATSYPGSPTPEILETIAEFPDVHAEWSPSEMVAACVAIGASMGGAAALCSMKHVGVNVASDPLMTFAYTRANGPFVLVVGDDPGMISSQNEQDSRMWAEYGLMPLLQPADPQDAYDLTRLAFDLSERFQTPAIVRMVDRTCHMAGRVARRAPVLRPPKGFAPDAVRYYMVPPFSRVARAAIAGRIASVRSWLEEGNGFAIERRGSRLGVVTMGHQVHLLREHVPDASLFRLAVVWPLPIARLREFAASVDRLVVVEELGPFVENHLKAEGIACEGKAHFPDLGEIGPREIATVFHGLGFAGPPPPLAAPATEVERSPLFCAGCPHRPVMTLLRDLGIFCHGDIGCYLMGSYAPFEVLQSSISMGASIGIAQGMDAALAGTDKQIPNLVSVIGDSTLLHSGLPGVINYAYNRHATKLLVLDNRSTSMTGCQDNPTSGKTARGERGRPIDVEKVLRALGIDDVVKVNQYRMDECRDVFRKKFLETPGPLAVIATGGCALKYKLKNKPPYYVDPAACISCRTCIRVSCPPISMRAYPGDAPGVLHSHIDAARCVGCDVCAQVCPVGAIRRVTPGTPPDVPLPVDISAGEGGR